MTRNDGQIISVIIPAHNEANVLAACLDRMLDDTSDALEVIVVCNGCVDSTAVIARTYDVHVIELDRASKTSALNEGDRIASHFPRFYVDADIKVSGLDLVRAARCLDEDVHAVSPAMRPVLEGRPWVVRAFYDVWTQLPYTQSLIGSGVFGLDAEARGRFDEFPEVIADDLFARLHLRPTERRVVSGTVFDLEAPMRVSTLIRVKTRAYLGGLQLREIRPDLFENEDVRHAEALVSLARHPRWWIRIAVYVVIRFAARFRALRQQNSREYGTWERDHTTREPM